MKSRRHRKHRKIEVVDGKVNLVDIKANRISRKLQVLRYQYDEDMNSVAKGLVACFLGVVFSVAMIIFVTVKLYMNGGLR